MSISHKPSDPLEEMLALLGSGADAATLWRKAADIAQAQSESAISDLEAVSKALVSLLGEVAKLRGINLNTPEGRMRAQVQHGILLGLGTNIASNLKKRADDKGGV